MSIDAKKLRELIEKATRGPVKHRWEDDGQKPDRYFAHGTHYIDIVRDDSSVDGMNVAIMQNLTPGETKANAELYAYLHNNAPAIADLADKCASYDAFMESMGSILGISIERPYASLDNLKTEALLDAVKEKRRLADEVERLRKAATWFADVAASYFDRQMTAEDAVRELDEFRTALAKPAKGGGE